MSTKGRTSKHRTHARPAPTLAHAAAEPAPVSVRELLPTPAAQALRAAKAPVTQKPSRPKGRPAAAEGGSARGMEAPAQVAPPPPGRKSSASAAATETANDAANEAPSARESPQGVTGDAGSQDRAASRAEVSDDAVRTAALEAERRQRIAQLAYRRAVALGLGRTDPFHDWLIAEREVDAGLRAGAC